MPTTSISDRRKRSSSPARDDRRDRRRRHEESERGEKESERRDWSSRKRPFDQETSGSKHQKLGYGTTERSRRVQEDDDDDGEEKPTRASRFVGERKQDDYRRMDTTSGGRNYGFDSFDNQRQSYRNRSDMPPPRRDDYQGRSGFDGGYQGAGGGYSRRGSSFGRWNSNRGRGGRGRTVVYRPGEDEQKPTMNLFDPSKVPKGRGYFEHEDRLSETNRRFRGRGRGRVVAGGRGGSWQNRRDFSGGRDEDVWRHDMFEEMETSDPSKNSTDITMEEGK